MSWVPKSVKSHLIAAFKHLLKPLVRLAIKNEVTLGEFGDALRAAYIGVARKQIGMSGGNATAEAIAMLLNVEPKEVSDALALASGKPIEYQESQVSPVSKVLSAWHSNPRYNGPYGVLVDLPFVNDDPTDRGGVSFSELSQTCCPHISPRVVLDEAMRTGCVVSVGSGFYRAIRRSYIPEPLSPYSINILAHVVHNLCETLERNLRAESGGENSLFQRTIFTDHKITQAELKAFEKYVRARGQVFSDDIDIWLSTRPQSLDSDADIDRVHTGIGIYHYVLNDEDDKEFNEAQVVQETKNVQ